jgi:hypothetical protein
MLSKVFYLMNLKVYVKINIMLSISELDEFIEITYAVFEGHKSQSLECQECVQNRSLGVRINEVQYGYI